VTSADVRERLIDALRLDLIGPEPGGEHADEVLPMPPSRWYLTGFLVPFEGGEAQRTDFAAQEEMDLAGDDDPAGVDGAAPEAASQRKAFLPSSIGVSVLVPGSAEAVIEVDIDWGDYTRIAGGDDDDDAGENAADGNERPARRAWQRAPRHESVPVRLPAETDRPLTVPVPGSGGLELAVAVRPVRQHEIAGVPAGTRSVAVFLVNRREPAPDGVRDHAFAFQASLTLSLAEGFVPRPDPRGGSADEWDEQVADLQYRDIYEFAVGHGVSTRALTAGGTCGEVATTWLPQADVERVEPAQIDVELGMEALADAQTPDELRTLLYPLVTQYGEWIGRQRQQLPDGGKRADVGAEMLKRADTANRRIAAGIEALEHADVFTAFRLCNRAMAMAARRRSVQQGIAEPDVMAPAWRPFQLAFLLMNLRGLAEPHHPDREVVDLLFFPTGGGKTEAYLGLAAFTLVLRRLRNPGIAAAGVSVLMRYTLRLLTLDQLGRAATLICALEKLRQGDVELLGTWPFEIGLWVGRAATPNRMGRKGDGDSYSARARTIAFLNDDRKPSPLPIENCPWCGTKFTRNSFQLKPNPDHPTDLRVMCVNRRCEFRGANPLPILAVDEPIYRRLPCFLIATVDKFAALPWTGQVGALFGRVDRHDAHGFYGPCEPLRGDNLPVDTLPPPDLIIQDELHLISGPLGTIAGLYEAAIDALASREVDGQRVRPRIIASTATVRRANRQIRALFTRSDVEVFPPPGPDRRDSFFARTVPVSERHARRYIGIAAQGRSLKVLLMRTYLALLTAAQKAYEEAGGRKNATNPADPYMTVLGYFNALRELGGSRRIVEDEVRARAAAYGSRLRVGESEAAFADRSIAHEVLELTSREPTNRVADAKRRLGLPFRDDEHVDVALATNMISVGLDITRLGLMVVLGQPKASAEYIQATSRVGRDADRSGLVVTLLNIHRARDRSHYERFAAYHASFYRAVEATSVTPFSPRAIDRVLAAVVVGLARQGHAALTAPTRAANVAAHRAELDFVTDTLTRRAEEHNVELSAAEVEELRVRIRGRVQDLLDEWSRIAHEKQKVGAGLQYQREEGAAPPLLFDPLDPALALEPPGARKFRAHRSMRDVEPEVNLWVRRLDGVDVPEEVE
jgi:hypothetical protein